MKPILVTGASTGIGRTITETLAGEGCLVYPTARKESDLSSLRRISNVEPIRLDVTKANDVKRAAEAVRKRGRGLHGLVNNAGIWHEWPLAESTDEDIYEILEVNLMGAHRVTRAMLPFLLKSKGRVVNITSVSGFSSTQFNGAYEISKQALEAYSDTLAMNLRPYGVAVSVVEPGTYRTQIGVKGLAGTRMRFETRRPTVMKKEIGKRLRALEVEVEEEAELPTPEAVAEAAMDALLSEHPKRRYMPCPTGAELRSTLEWPVRRVVQANLGAGCHSLSKSELHLLLDRVLDEEAER